MKLQLLHRRLTVGMGLVSLMAFAGGAGFTPTSAILAAVALSVAWVWPPETPPGSIRTPCPEMSPEARFIYDLDSFGTSEAHRPFLTPTYCIAVHCIHSIASHRHRITLKPRRAAKHALQRIALHCLLHRITILRIALRCAALRGTVSHRRARHAWQTSKGGPLQASSP